MGKGKETSWGTPSLWGGVAPMLGASGPQHGYRGPRKCRLVGSVCLPSDICLIAVRRGSVQGTLIIGEYLLAGLLDVVAKFQQKLQECLTSWMVRLWGMGADRISFCHPEGEKMSEITTRLAPRPHLHGQPQGDHYLMVWTIMGCWEPGQMRETYQDLPVPGSPQRKFKFCCRK